MRIQKSLETRLDLSDPDDILNPRLIEVCMKHLSARFEGKCYMSCLVLKILRIKKHSQRYMSRDLSGNAYIYVNFEVAGIIYNKGEIVTGCNIVKIEPDGRIHAKSKYAGLQIRQDSSLVNIYKEGQTVPFITKRVLYNPAQSAISIEALPFTPVFPRTVIYKISEPLNEVDKEKILYLFEQLREVQKEVDNLREISKKAYIFFQDLLYPFKKPVEFKEKDLEKRKLSPDIMEMKSGYLCQPRESRFHKMEIFATDKQEHESEWKIQEESLGFILETFLRNVTLHYRTLLEFVESYPTFDKVQEYKAIWRMFNMLKR